MTAGILSGMESQFLTSTDPLCSVEGGVLIWAARLTQQDIDALKQSSQGLRIVPNTPAIAQDRKGSSSQTPAGERKRQLGKRATLTVVRQTPADTRLSFLSTAPGKSDSGYQYAFFSQAGAGVRVYVVGTGMDPNNGDVGMDREGVVPGDEEGGLIDVTRVKWIFALGSDTVGSDMHAFKLRTCVASKIAGRVYGVSKETSLTIVRTRRPLASFIDALGKIIADLQNERTLMRRPNGRTVIHITYGWQYPFPGDLDLRLAQRVNGLISTLTDNFGAVVVCSAGYDNDYGDVSQWPAIISESHGIIAVGAVQSHGPDYGKRVSWSAGGLFAVSAPGNGLCAGMDGTVVEGADLATAVVSGLVASSPSRP